MKPTTKEAERRVLSLINGLGRSILIGEASLELGGFWNLEETHKFLESLVNQGVLIRGEGERYTRKEPPMKTGLIKLDNAGFRIWKGINIIQGKKGCEVEDLVWCLKKVINNPLVTFVECPKFENPQQQAGWFRDLSQKTLASAVVVSMPSNREGTGFLGSKASMYAASSIWVVEGLPNSQLGVAQIKPVPVCNDQVIIPI